MVAPNTSPRELPSRQRGIRIFAFDLESGPTLILARNPTEKLRRQVKGKLKRIARKIENAPTHCVAESQAGRWMRIACKAVTHQCLGAVPLSAWGDGWGAVEIPEDHTQLAPARLMQEQVGFLLAALDLAP